jgi:hypothetical protein
MNGIALMHVHWSWGENDHIISNVGTPSLEARNIRLVNIITYIIEESELISENMSPNVIVQCVSFKMKLL